MHYYKRNLGDYAKKAGRLSMLQHGSYTLLIDACYDREKFPTMDEAIEWTWASSTAEIEAVQFVLARFFVLVDGRYVQDRIQEEIDAYKRYCENNSRIATEREEKRKATSTSRARTVNETPPNQEPLTTNQEPVTKNVKSIAPPSGETAEVFEYWKTVMNHPKAIMDAKRERAIRARLKDGYTVTQLCMAVQGCKYDPFSQGANDRGTVFDDIELICRTGVKVEAFMRISEAGPRSSTMSGNQKKTIDNLQAYIDGVDV